MIDKIDSKVIDLILQEKKLREKFFVKIKDAYVFKTNDFKFFMEENKVNNSYTRYQNRIGLSDGRIFMEDSGDVVLDFPYKDCILEAGQSKEDSKREEVFFNQILAKDEIDRLLDDKTFVNWKRFTKKGEEKVKDLKMDDGGNIKENLIIKGNNLLALHSLKRAFSNKIKLIYIDPPYNTGSDSFGYNDNFNHSTWLTFMKNRLDVAKELLRDDGVIAVQCSFHEFAYLRVMMDDIFVKHLCDFNIQVRHPDRTLTGDKEFNDVMEYVIIFTNNKNKKMPYREIKKDVNEYCLNVLIKKNSKPKKIKCGDKVVEVFSPDMYQVIKESPSKSLSKKITIRGSIREKNSSGRFFVKYLEGLTSAPETLFKVPNMGDDAQDHRFFYSAPEGNKNGGYFQGMPTSSDVTKKQYSNFYNFEKQYNNVSKQGDVLFRNGKKPEELLSFLIGLFTSEKEIILDYHLGSGTTCAVAHKIDRQYIGIEQMDSQVKMSNDRLRNVINSDQTGISELVNWKGGGDFVYCELAKWNEEAKEKINDCKSLIELEKLFDTLYEKYFLNYNVKTREFKEKIIKEKEFKEFSLNEQKKIFLSMLDVNQMYVNRTEMEDKKFKISKEDKKLTSNFYGE